jgi:exosortase A-associated hydrolase 1
MAVIEPNRAGSSREDAIAFGDASAPMIGVVAGDARTASVAVLIVPGGAQNRCGSGRRFVRLARALAERGIPSLRFDYAGMGDSSGPLPHFESAGRDLGVAVDALLQAFPGVRGVVAWGLCDGATAAMLHAAIDPRIVGVVALNPWARTDAGRSAALVRTYYRDRLTSRAFWAQLIRGEVAVVRAGRSALTHLLRSARGDPGAPAGTDRTQALARRLTDRERPLPDRIDDALNNRAFPVLALVSRSDLTGAEFEATVRARGHVDSDRVALVSIEAGDHSLSREADWAFAVEQTVRFVASLASEAPRAG